MPQNDRTIHLDWRTASDGNRSCVECAPLADGGWAVRDSKDREGCALFFSPAEWDAFIEGIKRGEFDR